MLAALATATAQPPQNSGVPAADTTMHAVSPTDQVKKMTRGLNIIGYDPLWQDRAKARFQERHLRRIREGGFQTVRVNLHAFSHMNAANQLRPHWFKTLDWVVKSAVANDLTVILDEHNYNECAKDAAACKPKLMAFWEQVAPHYGTPPRRRVRDPERAERAG